MSINKIYLDYASASPLDERVKKAMQPFYQEVFFNPSTIYSGGLNAKKQLNSARESVARNLGCRPAEIIFTSGGSESNNLAIQGVMDNFESANALFLQIEHDSIIKPAENYNYKAVKVNQTGQVDIADLLKKIDSSTALVSIQLANNEIGAIQPVKQIAQLIKEIRKARLQANNNLPIYLHSDACQAVNYLDINAARLGVDLMSINAGKIYGPKGSGVLFIKAGTKIKPLIYGGSQEFGLRSGTENLAGIAGLAKALEIAVNIRQKEVERLAELNKYFYAELQKNLPNIVLNGPKDKRLPNNLSINFAGVDNERLIMRLDLMGLACSAGSACSASSGVPSHVLRAIGLSDGEARSSIRLSMGRQTTRATIDAAVKIISRAVELEQ